MCKIHGVGINDYDGIIYKDVYLEKCYKVWYNILGRCYNKSFKSYKYYGAKGVYVCDEWLYFSNFKEWYTKHHKEGYHIDKDALNILDEKGYKYYSPVTCRFLSPKDNLLEMQVRQTKDSKLYETQPVLRYNFKQHCKAFNKKIEDFIEIDSDKRQCGQSLYFYFYIHEQSQEKLNTLFMLKEAQDNRLLYIHESKGIYRSDFERLCVRLNKDFDDFIEIRSNEYKNNRPLYFYFYKRNLSPDRLSELMSIAESQLWYKKYETNSSVRSDFSGLCKRKNCDISDFTETFSGQYRGKDRKYFYTKN